MGQGRSAIFDVRFWVGMESVGDMVGGLISIGCMAQGMGGNNCGGKILQKVRKLKNDHFLRPGD